jgi:VIT1/CCC1 family predicted Fe2+/Mn2+ transporter
VSRLHTERHLVSRIGWLRAAVLGANDGIVSTASLIVGVAAASAATSDVLIAGVAGLVAGAMSMAAGEYVSVSSQSDTEQADLARERSELASQPAFEREELARIYIKRGVNPELAHEVADQLMAKDALGAHARDELGISEVTTARPVQAALTSASTFAVGAALPLSMVLLMPRPALVAGVSIASLVFSWPARRNRCAGRRGECWQGHPARHLLGRVGDGVDCGHRSDLRDGRLKRREEMGTVNEQRRR